MTMSKYDENKRKRRREGANEREKTRNIELNKAYDSLIRKMEPYIPHHADLPKIKRLRLAIEYIKFLEGILKTDENRQIDHKPKRLEDFAKTALHEIQARNSYSDRLHEATFERPRKNSFIKSPDSIGHPSTSRSDSQSGNSSCLDSSTSSPNHHLLSNKEEEDLLEHLHSNSIPFNSNFFDSTPIQEFSLYPGVQMEYNYAHDQMSLELPEEPRGLPPLSLHNTFTGTSFNHHF